MSYPTPPHPPARRGGPYFWLACAIGLLCIFMLIPKLLWLSAWLFLRFLADDFPEADYLWLLLFPVCAAVCFSAIVAALMAAPRIVKFLIAYALSRPSRR